jgi:hypothetical protein
MNEKADFFVEKKMTLAKIASVEDLRFYANYTGNALLA